MPDEMVEKVARAIYEARGAHEPPRAWRKWEDIGDEARAVWGRCAEAALSAAMERDGEAPFYTPEEMHALRTQRENANAAAREEIAKLKASPRPEAVGEDWRAVDDAIWFYLGHENHKPEDVARLRRMSGVVLGLAGEENKG